MGKRGPGARRQREAAQAVAPKRRKASWEYAGLSRAKRVIRFVQSLPITKGPLAGRRMELLPGQREFIEEIYSRPADDPVRIAVLSEPRGNGKTGLTAALTLAHLMGPEAQPRGECYAAAVDRGQSGKLFAEIEAIILATPELAARINIQRFAKKVEVMEGPGTGSVFEAMSGDARKGHGLAPSFWAYDELARVADRELLDALITGMAKRPCLGVVLSTQAPSDDHPLSQLIDDGLTGTDRSMLVRLTQAPEEADPFDPATVRACNPALGRFLAEADILAEQERARRMPSFAPNFRNLRLNQRVDAEADQRIVTLPVWKAGAVKVDRKKLKGRRCFGGLDLSGRRDLTALVLVFPSDDAQPVYDVLAFHWTPRDFLAERQPAEQERFRQWIDEGFITATPGNVISYERVARDMAALAEEFEIQAVAFDPHRIDYLRPELEDIGCSIALEPHQQGFISMFPAVERFAELALAGRLHHGGNPVLTAAVANAIVISDPAGNLKIDKGKGNARGPVRIDGAVALAMALNVAGTYEAPPPPPDLSAFLDDPVMVI